MKFESLEITFKIGTPMLLTHPFIAFDSLILHLLARKYYGADYNLLPSNKVLRDDDLLPEIVNIPIKRHDSGMYQASFSMFDEDILNLARFHYIRRKFEDKYLYFMKPVKKIGINKGTLKNYEMKIVQVSPERVRFYCFGIKKELEELLMELNGLGKKVNSGNGMISSFVIDSINDDFSFIKDGTANRSIPVRFLESTSRSVPMTWIPPYWARDKIEVCAPPGAKVKLLNNFNG